MIEEPARHTTEQDKAIQQLIYKGYEIIGWVNNITDKPVFMEAILRNETDIKRVTSDGIIHDNKPPSRSIVSRTERELRQIEHENALIRIRKKGYNKRKHDNRHSI